MSRRWEASDIAEYDAKRRSPSGFVDVAPDIKKRAQHKNPYLFHAAAYCRAEGLPEPVAEHYPLPDRDYRLDLAWPASKVAVEIQGGIFTDGAHSRGAGQLRDMEKHNLCSAAGWRIFYCVPGDVAWAIRTLRPFLLP